MNLKNNKMNPDQQQAEERLTQLFADTRVEPDAYTQSKLESWAIDAPTQASSAIVSWPLATSLATIFAAIALFIVLSPWEAPKPAEPMATAAATDVQTEADIIVAIAELELELELDDDTYFQAHLSLIPNGPLDYLDYMYAPQDLSDDLLVLAYEQNLREL
jgi:hypothetical protein